MATPFLIVQNFLMAFLWAAVLSFIPNVFYLLLNPLTAYRAELARKKKVFILKEEHKLDDEKHKRAVGVITIYLAALFFFMVILVVNVIFFKRASFYPFNLISTFSVILFWVSVLAYIPVFLYVIFRNPWIYKEEGLLFKRLFVFYGAAILSFSIFYSASWLRGAGYHWETSQAIASIIIISFSSAALAYLPILAYILFKITGPVKVRGLRPSVIFIIYSISFLIFSCFYIQEWMFAQKLQVPDNNIRVKFSF